MATWQDEKIKFGKTKFEKFQKTSIDLVKAKRLTILRVYISTEADLPRLLDQMRLDVSRGLGVRYIPIDHEAQRAEWPDVSLLWVPGTNTHNDAVIKSAHALDEDPKRTLEAASYDPLYALEFQSHSPKLLSEVKITSATRAPGGKHRDFNTLMGGFQQAWEKSTTVKPKAGAIEEE